MPLRLNHKFLTVIAGLLVLPIAVSCGQRTAQAPAEVPTSPALTEAAPARTTNNDVVSVVAQESSLSTISTALTETGLEQQLRDGDSYTIFAPSDEAFSALPEATRLELMKPENRDALREILSYHVVPGELTSDRLGPSQIQSLEGTPLTIDMNRVTNQVKVNNATVTQPDIAASNGVIHIVDQVILPPEVSMK